MEETEKEIESMRAASEEVSRQFKTLIDANDLDSLKHLQLLICYVRHQMPMSTLYFNALVYRTRVKRGIAPDMYPERDLRESYIKLKACYMVVLCRNIFPEREQDFSSNSVAKMLFLFGATICSLGRLQDSNAVLSHFNEYSEHCFAEVSSDFSRNTRMLKSMKSDLDYIFQKLRSMKAKIMATYPDAFPDESTREVFDQRPDLEVPQ
ncbi:hypothetical protein Gotri_026914 [Gossypium trilobum]|uniref:KxDL domain-containing protein n=1 Tax=Gossypium trilobum TaxID=34281 RepID=A0A7J9FS21_9ROSI|nr:hypothetical protein [Gossypium trilobum]